MQTIGTTDRQTNEQTVCPSCQYMTDGQKMQARIMKYALMDSLRSQESGF